MRGRLVLMATLAAVSIYGSVTGPLEASPTPGSVSEVAVPSSTVPATTAPTTAPPTAAPAASDDEPNPEDEPTPDEAVSEASEPTTPPEPTTAPTDPPAPTNEGPVQPGSPFNDDFETETSHWRPVNGSWAVQAGAMVQSDPAGFDLINELMIELPDTYNISIDLRAAGPDLGGGLVLGMSTPGSRRGAYLIDFTAGGEFLRWGRYDIDTGIYKYLGGLNVGTDVAQQHTLRIKVAATESTVFFDGDPMGTFDPVSRGHAALVTSESSVEFDNLLIEAL